MNKALLKQISEYAWLIEPMPKMHVPAVIYADEQLIEMMDEKVYEQLCNVTMLPGIVDKAYAMPDAHWGYGFPIGGVAAFDAEQGGVISGGGVGFDISCGVRTLRTGLTIEALQGVQETLADALYRHIPSGVGSKGHIRLHDRAMNAMLKGGAQWAVQQGYGEPEDLTATEEHGCMSGADPEQVSQKAKERQRCEMGTLGSGNHYLEVQVVTEIFRADVAEAFQLQKDDLVVSIHCGSRGLGHQIGTEFLRDMVMSAAHHHITLPERELACAPINSALGQSYLGAMRAGINCALANRQILTHLTREVFSDILPKAVLSLLYDVSHNTCKFEQHSIDGQMRELYVHRKGATRAFGPGHLDIPEQLRAIGQPVLIGGSMGTCSYILVGTSEAEQLSFSSACHGAGRAMSRHKAKRQWRGDKLVRELQHRGILIRSPSMRGVAEEAPHAYKDVTDVVNTADQAGLAYKVAKLEPVVCIKG